MKSLIRKLVDFSCRHSVSVIIGTAIFTVLLGFAAVGLDVDPDVESLLPENAEIKRLMDRHHRPEVSGEYLIVAIESEAPFTVEGLAAFHEMIERLKDIPGILPGMSPFNLVTFENSGGRIGAAPIAPEGRPPADSAELDLFLKRLMETRYAENLVRSADGSVLAAFFPAGEITDFAVLMESVRRITGIPGLPYTVHVSGSIPFVERTEIYLSRDFSRLTGFAALIILVFYFFGFKTIRGVLLPFLVVAAGTIWSLGFMALAGFSLTIVNIIIPPVVITLGSSYSIHILNQYYRGAVEQDAESSSWVSGVVETVNATVLLAAATTIAGFSSLLVTDIRQLREFALSAGVGIASCAALSLFFFPAALSRLKFPEARQVSRIRAGTLTRFMERMGPFIYRRRVLISVLTLLIPALFAVSIPRLDTNTDTIGYFPASDPVVADMYFMTEHLGGFDEVNLTLSAPDGTERYFLDLEILERVSDLEIRLLDIPDITYVSSFTTYLRSLNQAAAGKYTIPESRAPVILLSRLMKALTSDEAGQPLTTPLHNDDFSRLTLSFRVYNSGTMKFIDEKGLRRLLGEMEGAITASELSFLEPELWGMGLQYLSLADLLRANLLKSMLISLASVFALSALAFRSLRYGLLTLIPLAAGVMFNFILMTLTGIPLDMTTIMVSSIAVGVGVDDAIHFLLHYRRSAITHEAKADALRETLGVTGRPILLTTVSIVGGLSVLALASFRPIAYFGILVVFTLSTACVSTLLILPAVSSLTLGARSKKNRRGTT